MYWDLNSKSYVEIPGQHGLVNLDIAKSSNVVWENPACTITDLGDGILNLDWSTKMNTIGGDVLSGINKILRNSILEEQRMNCCTIRRSLIRLN